MKGTVGLEDPISEEVMAALVDGFSAIAFVLAKVEKGFTVQIRLEQLKVGLFEGAERMEVAQLKFLLAIVNSTGLDLPAVLTGAEKEGKRFNLPAIQLDLIIQLHELSDSVERQYFALQYVVDVVGTPLRYAVESAKRYLQRIQEISSGKASVPQEQVEDEMNKIIASLEEDQSDLGRAVQGVFMQDLQTVVKNLKEGLLSDVPPILVTLIVGGARILDQTTQMAVALRDRDSPAQRPIQELRVDKQDLPGASKNRKKKPPIGPG
jgi:hypothetical protein